MKLNSLTSKSTPKKADPVVNKTIKKQAKKDTSTYIPDVPFSIDVEISKNYEGMSDNILGVINSLNPVIKTFFNSSQLIRVKARQGYSEYILDNKFYLRIKDAKLAGKHHKLVTIKQGKKVLINNYVRI